MHDKTSVREFIEKINRPFCEGGAAAERVLDLRYGEPMSEHTTFKVGGNADVYVKPAEEIFREYAAALIPAAAREKIPVFILGGGANTVFADEGFRGVVFDTGSYWGLGNREWGIGNRERGMEGDCCAVNILSGTSIDELTEELCLRGLSGLEFLAGMPGSAGGALWMNARCYDKSVSDVLLETDVMQANGAVTTIPFCADDFGYKKSPFQNANVLILSARFAVTCGDTPSIRAQMDAFKKDRTEKGHYRFPSAGSAFKNNRAFGDPTGKIIDRQGLRGFAVGGAQIAPWHGNIIINKGGATAADIKTLMNEVARQVNEAQGFALESEVLFVGG
jgi:UDP-N-acetylmuramate dehydrogenase